MVTKAIAAGTLLAFVALTTLACARGIVVFEWPTRVAIPVLMAQLVLSAAGATFLLLLVDER